jgi:prophage antirepressor-like protein
MTQTDEILQYLRKHGQITEREALVELGIPKVSSCIGRMKQEGHKIDIEMVTTRKNRRMAIYRLAGEVPQVRS